MEPIDGVRKISNTSTGSLSACIYTALADYLAAPKSGADNSGSGFRVHYVVSEKAVRPEARAGLPVTFYPVTDVDSVASVLDKLMAEHPIGYVIHGMAVSDFTKDYLIEREALVAELTDVLEEAFNENREQLAGEQLRQLVRDTINCPQRKLKASSKVGSKADLMLSLKRTPKLIGKFKNLNPGCFLVGFKLLKGVSVEELIRVASALSDKNGCDLVLANDMNKIDDDGHEGLLIRDHAVVGRYRTKKEIAEGIVRHMLGGAQLHKDGSCL